MSDVFKPHPYPSPSTSSSSLQSTVPRTSTPPQISPPFLRPQFADWQSHPRQPQGKVCAGSQADPDQSAIFTACCTQPAWLLSQRRSWTGACGEVPAVCAGGVVRLDVSPPHGQTPARVDIACLGARCELAARP